MSLVKTLSAKQTIKQVTTKVTLYYTKAEFKSLFQHYYNYIKAEFNADSILQVYHGEVKRRFQQFYSYITAEFNIIFNNITGIPRRSLSPFSTILQLYHGGV